MTQRLKIWQLLDSGAIGGIETHVALLAEGLRDAGHDTAVIFLKDHGPHPLHTRLAHLGLPRQTLDGTLSGLAAALRAGRPDIVHTHGYKAGILGRLVARLLGLRAVSTFHAGEPGTGRVRLYVAIDRLTACLGRRIAVSRPILMSLGPDAVLVENFVRLPDPVTLAHDDRPRTVAFVGRLSHEKGPDLFCRIAELSPPDIRFEIYGDGPMQPQLQQSHGARVVFHGMVADMDRRWSRIGLLCMPSRHEGLPMAALEAMSHGVPVAATSVGDLPGLIEHGVTGWLAPPEGAAALAGHIAEWSALNSPAAALMSQASRATIASRHSLEAGTAKILTLYANML